jgi:hypothetical protein
MFIFFIPVEMRRAARYVLVEVLILTCISIGILVGIGFAHGVRNLEPVISFVMTHSTAIMILLFVYVFFCGVMFIIAEPEQRTFAIGALVHALLMVITVLILYVLGQK